MNKNVGLFIPHPSSLIPSFLLSIPVTFYPGITTFQALVLFSFNLAEANP
jgi:hypothetical protein